MYFYLELTLNLFLRIFILDLVLRILKVNLRPILVSS